jgi:NAD(P)-dependent dehydrogenase (short-subunit alcohol dehydrogenase family)
MVEITEQQIAFNGTKPPMHDVEGKVAFVTGGDSGIGLGITRAFLNAGMKVVITYRTKSHLHEAMKVIESAGDRIHAINLDVTDRVAMAAAAVEAIRVFGKVHVLVNNAGVGGGPVSGATFDDWDWCMSVNIDGVFNGIHTFLPAIKAHGEGGQIVATSSIHGLVAGPPFITIYTASKFAIVGLMEGLRSELANVNIGASVFCPGRVNVTNLEHFDRNRPAALSKMGVPGEELSSALHQYSKAHQEIMDRSNGMPGMDALEAGERLLRGIRHNYLYILSHAEYLEAIRERNEALLASFPVDQGPLPVSRYDLERVARTSIYHSDGATSGRVHETGQPD